MLRLAVLSTICALVICAGLAWGADAIRAAATAGPEAALHSETPAKSAHQQTLPECAGLDIDISSVSYAGNGHFILENNSNNTIHNIQFAFFALSYDTHHVGQSSFSLFNSWGGQYLDRSTNVVTKTIPMLEPYSTHRVLFSNFRGTYSVAEVNAAARVFRSRAYDTALCETPFVKRLIVSNLGGFNGSYIHSHSVDAALDRLAAGVGDKVTFRFTFFSADSTIPEACLNFHFEDGLTPDHGGAIFYDGPNGAYRGPDDPDPDPSRYGEQKTAGADPGFYARSTRLEYEHDGQDDYYGAPHHRPQCSDAGGKYRGGLLHIGTTRANSGANTHFPTGWFNLSTRPAGRQLYYIVEAPATVNASGSPCATVTARALPARDDAQAAEASTKTTRICVQRLPAPAGAPPVLLDQGRADLLTLQKCASAAQLGCAGKSAGDLTLNVVSAEGASHRTVTEGNNIHNAATKIPVAVGGNAAMNAGSDHRIFRPGDVVVHVPDAPPVGPSPATRTRYPRVNVQANYPVNKTVWYTGNDIPNIPDTGNNSDPNDFGLRAGVAAKYRFPGADYNKYYLSICPEADAAYLADPDDTTGVCTTTADSNPGNMRALLGETWTTTLFDIKDSQPTTGSAGYDRTSLDADGLVWEFSALGTYKADLVVEGRPTGGTKKAAGAYTFHVGPVTELSVSDAALPSGVTLGPGQTALVVEARNNYAKASSPAGTRVQVTLPSGATVVTATASEGEYDKVNNVWKLGRGLSNGNNALTTDRATLTLALSGAAAGAAGSAQIYHPECFNAATGAAIHPPPLQTGSASWADVKNREACLADDNNDDTPDNTYGSYAVCVSDQAIGKVWGRTLPHETKAACDAAAGAHTWHVGNVLDYHPANNVATLTQKTQPSAFILAADAIDEQTVRLAWAGHAGADGYRIYRVVGDELDALSRVAELPAGASSYRDRTLSDGETRYYRVAARQNGQDVAVTNAASATARQVAPLPARNVGEALGVKPATVSNLAAVRSGLNAAYVNLFWNPASDASFYQVQYREASTQPAGEWTTAVSALFFPKYQFTGAKSGARYQFRVRAMNGAGSRQVPGAWTESGVVPKAVYGNPRAYAYTLTAGSNFGKRDPARQFELHLNNANPQGAWSNGTTLWVADFADAKVYAYTLTSGSDFGKRDTTKEFDLDPANVEPRGIWSNGTTLWVADSNADEVYAYTLTSGSDFGKRDTTKEFDLTSEDGHGHAGSTNPRGIWSNATTLWVADALDGTVHAHKMTPGNDFGEHDESKETDLHADNANPEGLWSDGTTLWVADPSDDKVYAYTLATNVRDTTKEFLLAAGNSNARGIWSNDTTLWVADSTIPLQVEPPPPGRVNDVRTPSSGASRVVTWAHAPYATHYDVESTSDGGTTWKREASDYAIASSNFNVDSFRVSYTLTVDNANGAYHVRVRGKNHTADATPVLRVGPWTDDLPPSAGVSGASAASGAAAATQLPDAPDAVGSVSVTHHGDSLSASWTAAARAGAYQVAYSGDNGATWTTAADAHGSTSITISGVDPGATYLVSVRAYNDGGASSWTDSAPASPPGGGGSTGTAPAGPPPGSGG